uniref:Uncharacterized protein n=1 Tax=Vespula pensylvanica TaxID=30213 RepID=A0A834U7C1_VESPE|nr:hypothetical protein H0235_010080 [Vespula pensylvanica]
MHRCTILLKNDDVDAGHPLAIKQCLATRGVSRRCRYEEEEEGEVDEDLVLRWKRGTERDLVEKNDNEGKFHRVEPLK